jgi:PAS domain S-box-containing protein
MVGPSEAVLAKVHLAKLLAPGQISLPAAVWITAVIIMIVLLMMVAFQRREKKLVDLKLQALQQEYERLLHDSPCGYHMLDEQGYFLVANDTLVRWLNYDRHELIGKVKFADLASPSDRVLVDKAISMARAGGTPKGQFSLLKKNEEEIPVLLRVLKIGGKVLYCTLDNTECRRAMDRIKNLDQELEGFSYSISHDLRAPLRSIDGYSKILQEDYGDKLDVEGKRVLNVIMNNARRMGKLIDDLLEFSRLGRKDMQLTRVDMQALADHVAQQLLAELGDRRIEVKVHDLQPAVADADMMQLVWSNLLDNAMKFTGKKDTAVIDVGSFTTDDGHIGYVVKDNGVGFDMKYAPKLFGVFQRLHKIQDFPGTGVGLAIVKRIVSRHGGRVWTEAHLNDGAIFYFTIPIEEQHA